MPLTASSSGLQAWTEAEKNRKTIFRNSTTKLRNVRKRRVNQQGSNSSTSTSSAQFHRVSESSQSHPLPRPLSQFSHWSENSSQSPTQDTSQINELLSKHPLDGSLVSTKTGWSGFSGPSAAVPQRESSVLLRHKPSLLTVPERKQSLEDSVFVEEEQQVPLAGSDRSSLVEESLVEAQSAQVQDAGVVGDSNLEFFLINCSGTLFEVSKAVLQRYPLVVDGIFRDGIPRPFSNNRTEYFFNRDPELFRYVLLYCRYDEMHVPNHICGPLLEREITAWGVPFGIDLQRCCFGHVMETKSQLESLQRFEDAFRDDEESDSYTEELLEENGAEVEEEVVLEKAADLNSAIGTGVPNISPSINAFKEKATRSMSETSEKVGNMKQKWSVIRRTVWNVLDKPTSSIFAAMYSLMVGAAVVLAVFVFVAGTNSYFHSVPLSGNVSLSLSSLTSTKTPQHFSHHEPPRAEWLGYAEYVCIAIFTLDIIARLVFSRHKLQFLRNAYTLVDILSIIPFYFETIYHMYFSNPQHDSLSIVEVVGFLKITLVLRLMRIFRHYRGLQVLLYTLKTSLADLLLIFVLLSLANLFFATLIYFAEKDRDFKSIPHGFWWSIITMTTVGYGDYYPETLYGYIIGVGCALAGNVLITLTIPILVSHFMLYYSHSQIVIESRGLQAFMKEELNTKFATLRENFNFQQVQQRFEAMGDSEEENARHPALASGLAAVARTAVAMPEFIVRRNVTPDSKKKAAEKVLSEYFHNDEDILTGDGDPIRDSVFSNTNL